MNKKQIHTLLVILAVLVAGIFIRQQQAQRGVVTEDYSALSFAFDKNAAVKIVFVKDSKTQMTALKEAGQWILPELWNAKASSAKIETFLEGLSTARGELRADDESLLADFGISDDLALGIRILNAEGESLADLKVGSQRAGTSSVFLRRAGTSAVYYADLDLFRQLGLYGQEITAALEPRLWADLEPLKLATADVQSIEIQRHADGKMMTTAHLTKTAGEKPEWKFSTDDARFELDPAQVETYLRGLSNLKASSVFDPSENHAFETTPLELKISTPEKVWTVTFGKDHPEQKTRSMRVAGDDSIYEVTRFTFEDLFADDSRFFKTGFPKLEQAPVEKFTLTKQGQTKTYTPADTDAFESIRHSLSSMRFEGLLLTENEKKKSRSPGLDTLTLEFKAGAPAILDIGEKMEGPVSRGARYAAQIRGNTVLFSISESDYEDLFEVFKSAESPQPPTPETNASQPAVNKAE